MGEIYYGGNDYRDYLAHHGVLGMKWGIRRYQPYSVVPRGSGKGGKEIGEAKAYGGFGRPSAGKIRRTLNKLDKQQAKLLYTYEKESGKADKATRKASKRMSSIFAKKDDPVTNRLLGDAYEHNRVASLAKDALQRSEAQTWKIIASAAENGYDVSSKKVMRDAVAGQRLVAGILAGSIGIAAFSVLKKPLTGHSGFVEGNKYTVTDNKKDELGKLSMEQYRQSPENSVDRDNDVSRDTIASELREKGITPSKENVDAYTNAKQKVIDSRNVHNSYLKRSDWDEATSKDYEHKHLEAEDDMRNLVNNMKAQTPSSNNETSASKNSGDSLWKVSDQEIRDHWDINESSARDELAREGIEATAKNIKAYNDAKTKSLKAYDEHMNYAELVQDFDYEHYSREKDDQLAEAERKAERDFRAVIDSMKAKQSNNPQYGGKRSSSDKTSDMAKQQKSRIKALKSSGLSYAEIAKRLGISEGSVSYYLNS